MITNKMVTNEVKEQIIEKELYSKECVVETIKFVVGEASHEIISKNNMKKFSCNLATILARDHEVVAVWLELSQDGCIVYLSKNFTWSENDIIYINKIMNYLSNISKNAPVISKDL